MSRMKIATLSLLIGFVGLVGCATDPSSGDDVVGDDAPPFTSGTSTLSGSDEPGFVDGKRGAARFANPVHCAVGPDGQVYVADFDNGKIRVVHPETGLTSTVIAQDKFRRPFGMLFIGGTLYVGTDNNTLGRHDVDSGTVWRVNVQAKAATVVVENIGRARGMTAMSDGRIALTDYQRHVVKILDPSSGSMSLLAGTESTKGMIDATGASALFAQPYHLVQRPDGKLIVADYENNRLRLVDLAGNVTTFAGTGVAGSTDGSLATAQFSSPQGLAITSNGDIFVTDAGSFKIRRIRGDVVTTVAGSTAGHLDHDDNLMAQFYGLEGLCAKPDGSMLFVSDGGRGEDLPYNYLRSVKL